MTNQSHASGLPRGQRPPCPLRVQSKVIRGRKIRFAIVGCGRNSRNHFAAEGVERMAASEAA